MLAEDGDVGCAGSQGGKPAWVSAKLKHGDLPWIAAELFNGQLSGVIGSGTEAADRQLFAVKFGGRLNLRPNDELERKKIDAAGDNRGVSSLKIGRHGESAGGESHL